VRERERETEICEKLRKIYQEISLTGENSEK
jgi:hypothetical protein